MKKFLLRLVSPAFVFLFLMIFLLLTSYLKSEDPKYPQIILTEFDTNYRTGEISELTYAVLIQGTSNPYEMVLEVTFLNSSKLKLKSYKNIINIDPIKYDEDGNPIRQKFINTKRITTELADKIVYTEASLKLLKKKY